MTMKSFLESLPSQRKREKVRKSRHNRSRGSRGHGAGDDPSSRRLPGSGGRGLGESPCSIVEATAGGKPFARRGVEEDETTPSQTQSTVVEATQFQYPAPAKVPAAAAGNGPGGGAETGGVGRAGRRVRSAPDPMPSPVKSADVGNCGVESDTAYDEETVGATASPLGAREEIFEPEAYGGPGEGASKQGGPTDQFFCGVCDDNEGNDENDEPPRGIGSERESSLERKLSLDTEPRGNMGRKDRQKENDQTRNVNTNGREGSHANGINLSLEGRESSEAANEKAGGGATGDSPSAHNNEENKVPGDEHSPLGEQEVDGGMELVLTTADIRDCVKAMAAAKEVMEKYQNQDPFHSIDIEQWQTTFEDFEKYIAALGDPGSTEFEELQQIGNHDKVYAIFDRGMGVNDCNALFIYKMIRTISGEIDDYDKRHPPPVQNQPSQHRASNKKLKHLAACLDLIFGVSEGLDLLATTVTVSVLKQERNDSTILKLSRKIVEGSIQDDELSPLAIQQPMPYTLQPHLHAMSQVFERFAGEKARALQSQLDSTRKTLAITREGAMDLQRQALKLQDDLQDAQTEAAEAKAIQERTETEMGRQKYEFERREESFERVKERYKAEIDQKELELAKVREWYDHELKEAKAELTRVKHSHSEQRTTKQRKRKESDHRSGKQLKYPRTEHQRCNSTDFNPNANLRDEAAGGDEISPSIPRKIEYEAINPFGGDVEELRKRIKIGDQPKHSMGNMSLRKSYPSAPYEPQPPWKPRASSEPKKRDARQRMGEPSRHSNRNCEQVDKISGYIEQLGSAKKRNPLKSLTENSLVVNNSDIDAREKKEARRRRERSSKKDSQAHDGGVEGEDGNKTATNVVLSSREHNVVKNPYPNYPAKKPANDGESTFAYQEVVRGRDLRRALPGHDCEECRKFLNALGEGDIAGQMVMECSRHRAHHAPPSTPPDFWKLTFVDSVSSERSAD